MSNSESSRNTNNSEIKYNARDEYYFSVDSSEHPFNQTSTDVTHKDVGVNTDITSENEANVKINFIDSENTIKKELEKFNCIKCNRNFSSKKEVDLVHCTKCDKKIHPLLFMEKEHGCFKVSPELSISFRHIPRGIYSIDFFK